MILSRSMCWSWRGIMMTSRGYLLSPLFRCCSSSLTPLAIFLNSLSAWSHFEPYLVLPYYATPIIGCVFKLLGCVCVALHDERQQTFVLRIKASVYVPYITTDCVDASCYDRNALEFLYICSVFLGVCCLLLGFLSWACRLYTSP